MFTLKLHCKIVSSELMSTDWAMLVPAWRLLDLVIFIWVIAIHDLSIESVGGRGDLNNCILFPHLLKCSLCSSAFSNTGLQKRKWSHLADMCCRREDEGMIGQSVREPQFGCERIAGNLNISPLQYCDTFPSPDPFAGFVHIFLECTKHSDYTYIVGWFRRNVNLFFIISWKC